MIAIAFNLQARKLVILSLSHMFVLGQSISFPTDFTLAKLIDARLQSSDISS